MTAGAPTPQPQPQFKIGDQVFVSVNGDGSIGEIAEIKNWGDGTYSYRIIGPGFHPRQFYNESILSLLLF